MDDTAFLFAVFTDLIYSPDVLVSNFATQVVDGGDLDIDFQAYDGSLKRIAINRRESYGTHTFTVKESGVYKFCFSNKFRLIFKRAVW